MEERDRIRRQALVVTASAACGLPLLCGIAFIPLGLGAVEAETVSVSINEQVEAAIAPFGDDVTPEKMPEVQKRAEAAFADALRARGLDASRYRILVHAVRFADPRAVTDAVYGILSRALASAFSLPVPSEIAGLTPRHPQHRSQGGYQPTALKKLEQTGFVQARA